MDSLVTIARKGNHNNCRGEKVWEAKGAPSSDQSCDDKTSSFAFFFDFEVDDKWLVSEDTAVATKLTFGLLKRIMHGVLEHCGDRGYLYL